MNNMFTFVQVKRLLITTVIVTSTLVWALTYFTTKNSAQEQYFAKQMEMLKASEEQYQKMHSPLNAIIGDGQNNFRDLFKK
jgi:uncharacterized protein YxeA